MNNNLQNAKLEPVWHTNKFIFALIFFLVTLFFFFPFINPSNFQLHLMIMIFMYAVMAQSWNVIAGFSGQISLGHVIFFGIGGYTSSFFYVEYGITPWIGIFVGILFSSLVAIAIGIPMLRLSGHYFAIATLLIGFSFQIIFQRWDLIGAASGLWIPLNWDSPWLTLQFHESKIPYYYIFLIFFLLSYFSIWILYRSKIGFKLRAIRDDPQAATSLGIPVAKYKIIAFVISAIVMSPMGSLFAQYILVIEPERMFDIEISIIVLLIAVMGGVGNVWGPLIGTIILIPLSEYTRIFFGGTGGSVDLIIYGILIMLICIFRPSGLISFFPKKILERKKF